MNFHPDRAATGGRDVLTAMAQDGVYRSQFVTRTGNGGLTAHPGGDRWLWESRIFGGAYDSAPAAERPVYGALNFRRDVAGGAPRFGSSYFRLTARTLARATFCYPDSSTGPTAFATAGRFSLLGPASADSPDALDRHVEAQIHGPVRFDRDVEALVLDACYRGTPVEHAARRLPCALEWHPGFRLTVAALRRHPGYRGLCRVVLGERIAVDGELTPAVIGDAVRAGLDDPQNLKKVWHCLARFGAPHGRTVRDGRRPAVGADNTLDHEAR
ncbi:DUF3626 domain-containing protein [Streptomyces sp. NPDC090306]|uniref:DUF3626 domain-containing protein n=1 Tax=Streptomyces sp. NPDC090306 TaxID=3365961 RepID=UPI00382C4317